MTATIDLNCDLGEGLEGETDLLDIVSSANICCGLHAGDPLVLRATLLAAKQRGVIAGAHPGYADKANFGRQAQYLQPSELRSLLLYQYAAIDALAKEADWPLRHVRSHGALANQSDNDPQLATLVAESVAAFCSDWALMVMPGSAAERAAANAGLPVVRQFFADRDYHSDGSLVSRQQAGAVFHDAEAILARALTLLDEGCVYTREGDALAMTVESITVHGDSPDALRCAETLRSGLEARGVSILGYDQNDNRP